MSGGGDEGAGQGEQQRGDDAGGQPCQMRVRGRAGRGRGGRCCGGGRGRWGFCRGGRGRGRGRVAGRPAVTREQLDNQLDAYMSKTKGHLDAELDAYMAQADTDCME